MHIHEYQAKELFKHNGIQVPDLEVISNSNETRSACKKLGGNVWVVKAQVHAGGRGKGGGVIVCNSIEDAEKASQKLLGKKLVTPQTDEDGQPINQVIIEAGQDIFKELYLGLLVDRSTERITILASTEGGMDIEQVASESPEKIIKHAIDPLGNLSIKECQSIAKKLNLNSVLWEQFTKTLIGLYSIFTNNDGNLIEINPLIISKQNEIIALDGKMMTDDNSNFRHEELLKYREQTELEEKAEKSGFSLVELDGNVAVIGNGAGLVMSTFDMLADNGGKPACFLDVGGGATEESVYEALTLISKMKNVKAILVNLYGGIVKTTIVASAFIKAYDNKLIDLPVYARLMGAESEKSKEMLKDTKTKMFSSVEQAINGVVMEVTKTG